MKTTSTIKVGWGRLALFVTALALALGESELRAADGPPELINYQGYLEDGDGDPLGTKEDNTGQLVSNPTNYKVQFQMYDQQVGGNSKWVETQIVTVDNGYFNVYLGESERITGAHFTGTLANQRFMGITVDLDGLGGFDESEIAPRLRLLSTPYAMLSDRALTAGTLSSDSTSGPILTVDNNVGQAEAKVNGKLEVTGDTKVVGEVTASSFVGFGTVPLGGIIMWSGSDEPDGWAICNGQMKNGVTTPDLTGRFIVGAGTSALLASQRITKPDGGNYEVNEDKGGLNEVALTTKEMPSHEHSGSGTTTDDPERNDGDHKHKGNNKTNLVDSGDDYHVIYPDEVDYSGDATIGQFGSQHKHDFDFTTNATGGKEDGETKAHENRPPYYALAFIMRVN